MSGESMTLKEVSGLAGAVTQRIDQGYGSPLNWDQTREAVEHPTTGIKRVDLVQLIAYLGAQLVGARHSIDAEAVMAVGQIESILRDLAARRSATAKPTGADQ